MQFFVLNAKDFVILKRNDTMNIIGAFDRSRVSELEPRKNSVLISITSIDSTHPHIKSGWHDVLYLKFDDVEGRSSELGNSANLITDKDAKQILNFVVKNIDCDFFINCDAGISRSTGVLVALELIFNGNDVSHSFQYHNRFVKNRIKDTWFKTIWEK